MKIMWIGHSAFLIEGPKNLIIDPYIKDNPKAAKKVDDIPKLDYIFITHDHQDHIGDAFFLAKRDDATIIAIHEISEKAGESGIKSQGMNRGGSIILDDMEITMTNAIHSSDLGRECGFVIGIDGKNIYHAGDTALFGDMALIGQMYPLDLALLPIGDRYTMGPKAAAMAVKLLRPKLTIPMHYGTFPLLTGNPADFSRLVGDSYQVKILETGESIELYSKK